MLSRWLRRFFTRKTASVGRDLGAKRPGAARRTLQLEALEDRTLLAAGAVLDITGGALTYTAGAGISNNLTVSVSGSNYVFNDTGEAITLTANAVTAGWTGSTSNTVSISTNGVTPCARAAPSTAAPSSVESVRVSVVPT